MKKAICILFVLLTINFQLSASSFSVENREDMVECFVRETLEYLREKPDIDLSEAGVLLEKVSMFVESQCGYLPTLEDASQIAYTMLEKLEISETFYPGFDQFISSLSKRGILCANQSSRYIKMRPSFCNMSGKHSAQDKGAIGYLCILCGALLCVIPSGATQVVGGALISTGVSIGASALNDMSHDNRRRV